MSNAPALKRYRVNLQDEVDSAYLYRAIADVEKSPQLAEVYRQLAATETQHAQFWRDQLRAANAPEIECAPTWRARTLAWLAHRLGANFVLATLRDAEHDDSQGYAAQPESANTALPAQENSHARILSALAAQGGGLTGSAIAQFEGRHRAAGGNALRAAVLGANDGLVSNLSLIMGVAGAAPEGNAIVIAGLAGLLAGACSMALGEWVSVQSSRELYERQIKIERAEILSAPQEEQTELALIYESKGLSAPQARIFAARVMQDQATALDTLAREELGIDPQELGGSAIQAATASFMLFATGALIPLFPFLLWQGTTAILASVTVSALGLFGIGAAITLMTGRSVWHSGLRMALIGLGAALVTHIIGRLIGTTIAG
ncbi:MAG: rubrerythrin family protein [Chloroflexi bacterium UTCFX4]|nr:MAG: rubrerythrin family protein [Chloroflexi bacterium UTCFX4]